MGTVKTDTKNNDNIFGLYIEFRVDTLVIARNIIQQDGTFKISATADKDFDIYYRGIGVGDTYVQTIKPTEKDTVSLTFKVPRDYKKYFKLGSYRDTLKTDYENAKNYLESWSPEVNTSLKIKEYNSQLAMNLDYNN